MDGIAVPDEAFAVAVGRVEEMFELLDPFFGAAKSKYAFYAGR